MSPPGRGRRLAPVHPRPRARRLSSASSPITSASRTWSASATGPTPSRSPCGPSASARRRGRLPVAHLLRHRRGDRERRRHAGLLRRRPGHLVRHRRDGPPASDRAHEGDRAVHLFGNVRPCRSCASSACPCSRTPPRPPAPRSTGARPARSATPPRSASSPRRTCPAWVTAARSPRRRRGRRARRAAALPRLEGQAPPHRDGLQLAARPIQAAVLRILLPGARRLERGAPRGVRELRARGLGRARAASRADGGAEHVYHLYVVRSRDADELAARSRRAGVARAATTARRCTASRRWSASPAPSCR